MAKDSNISWKNILVIQNLKNQGEFQQAMISEASYIQYIHAAATPTVNGLRQWFHNIYGHPLEGYRTSTMHRPPCFLTGIKDLTKCFNIFPYQQPVEVQWKFLLYYLQNFLMSGGLAVRLRSASQYFSDNH